MSVFDHVWKDGQASEAAAELRNGAMIDWQPSDGTRYELVLLRHSGRDWLICPNNRWVLPLYPTMTGTETLVRMMPDGTYAGIRPLLAALGLARGGEWFRWADQNVAAAVRDIDLAKDALRTAESDAHIEGTRKERDANDHKG